MDFYNIEDKNEIKSFREAVLDGSGKKRGLLFPAYVPKLSKSALSALESISLPEMASELLYEYLNENFTKEEVLDICNKVFDFPVPLVKLEEKVLVLELFHGPSLAFKDFGARFLAEVLKKFASEEEKITVLVATSGDTGSAVAQGFHGTEGVDVVLLYPSGKISPLQEKTLTTVNGNIYALEIEGTFDDCQRLVKTAFADDHLNQKLKLTSANSINVGRWLPQIVYYFHAWKQLSEEDKQNNIFSVPSGNYGNLSAGLLARKMGLPVEFFVASSNINKVIPDYLETGLYKPRQAVPTLSNAMDVGNPSNFSRILELFEGDYGSIKKVIKSHVVTDREVRETIKNVHEKFSYLLDPHGAVAYKGLKENCQGKRCGIFLETAHPGKFNETVEEITGEKLELPGFLKHAQEGEKNSTRMSNRYSDFKNWLLDFYNI